jgi:hypothetical protein
VSTEVGRARRRGHSQATDRFRHRVQKFTTASRSAPQWTRC